MLKKYQQLNNNRLIYSDLLFYRVGWLGALCLRFKVQDSRLIFFVLLFLILNFQFSILNSYAQQPVIDIDEQAQNRIMTAIVENCDFAPFFNVNTLAIIKNKQQIPAYGLYQNSWDTSFIRSEKMEIPFFDNQLKIMLIQDGNTPFAFPFSGNISTNFVKNKGKQHTGIDFSVSKNEPVVACFDGVVRIAKKYEEYGNTLVIRHYNGLETVYALLDKVCVVTEQKVNAGELIGYVNHLSPNKKNFHFEIRFLNEFFNPEKVIHLSERRLQSNMLTLTPNDFIPVPVAKPNAPVAQEQPKQEQSASLQQLLEPPKFLPVYHTVQKGETIYRICSKYNITEQQLRALNNIKGDRIELGQKLRVK